MFIKPFNNSFVLLNMTSDRSLIVLFQKGIDKEKCFTELMENHQKQVYFQIRKMVGQHEDAADVAQSVWIKVWEKLDRFKMESEFSTWVFRIAYNESVNFINKNKRIATEDFVYEENGEENKSMEKASLDGPNQHLIESKLDQAIRNLPEKQRFVFFLRYFQEFDYQLISNITQTTVGGAKANFHQAYKKVEEFLKNH